MSKDLPIWPWDKDVKPYWVNPDNGYHWYVDKTTTEWANGKRASDVPPLNAVGFIVAKEVDGEINPLSRVLIDKKTNREIYNHTNLESLAVRIDILRVAKQRNVET